MLFIFVSIQTEHTELVHAGDSSINRTKTVGQDMDTCSSTCSVTGRIPKVSITAADESYSKEQTAKGGETKQNSKTVTFVDRK